MPPSTRLSTLLRSFPTGLLTPSDIALSAHWSVSIIPLFKTLQLLPTAFRTKAKTGTSWLLLHLHPHSLSAWKVTASGPLHMLLPLPEIPSLTPLHLANTS